MKQLEQILDILTFRKYKTIDVYALGTTALYSGPNMNFSVPLAYNNSAPNPLDRQTTLYDYGIMQVPEFKLPEIIPIDTIEFNKNIYAKNCEDYNFGTIESVNINPETKERIKIYTDIVNNKISVGYEPFDRSHTDKDYMNFDNAY